MDDISVAGPFGENKTRRIGSFDGQNYDDDDDDDYTSRWRKVRKHEESFVGILSHLQKISKY